MVSRACRLSLLTITGVLFIGPLSPTEIGLATPEWQTTAATIDEIEFEPGERIDSSVCGTCHIDIYNSWKGSVHEQSFLDPVFQQGLAKAISLEGPEIGQLCLTCHSPATVMLDMQRPDQLMEGVNCQFCHALRGIDHRQFPPFDVNRDLVVYGPSNDAESPVHEIISSPFMRTAEYCASCHEYTGPSGAKVLSTFTEYETGAYPELVECQGCHMPLVLGHAVDPTLTEAVQESWIHSHAMPGGRDINQLRRAVRVRILSMDRIGSAVDVQVAIENRAAGHWLPTGMPSRRMVLEVSTDWGEKIQAHSIVFGRRVVDAENRLLRSLPTMILHGTRIVNDTRLRPMQRRTFKFTLPAPIGLATDLQVRVFYESSELPSLPPVREDIVRIVRRVE